MNLTKTFESHSNPFTSRRKTLSGGRQRGHFRFNTISALVILVFIALGLGIQALMTSLPDPETTSYLAAGVISAAAVLFILPYWPMVIAIIAGIWAVLGASAFAKQAAQEAAVVSPAKDEPSEEELKNDD